MRMNDFLISALDLLTLFVVMLFLALMAIKYDASKGLADKSYVKVYNFQEKPLDLTSGGGVTRFQFISLDQNSLRLTTYENERETLVGSFETVEAFISLPSSYLSYFDFQFRPLTVVNQAPIVEAESFVVYSVAEWKTARSDGGTRLVNERSDAEEIRKAPVRKETADGNRAAELSDEKAEPPRPTNAPAAPQSLTIK